MAAERDSEKVACDIAVTDPYPRPPGGRGRYHCDAGGPDATAHPHRLVAGSQKMVRNGLGGKADFSYWQCYEGANGPIAQLDRVTDFYSVGCRFESCWDRHLALSATVRRPPPPSAAIWIALRSPCTTGNFSFPQFPRPSTCVRLHPKNFVGIRDGIVRFATSLPLRYRQIGKKGASHR
jgi:hypothetical protein